MSVNEYKITIYLDKDTLYHEKTVVFSSFNVSTFETSFILHCDLSSKESTFNEIGKIEIPAEAVQ
ncbi:DUF6612 family protein [Rossellomorea vietnamensis]|uniref:DUF6612 family protein n=1 Tax=Rossellomorea vietnamensis TaxID=218284 RepID=UPI003CE6B736